MRLKHLHPMLLSDRRVCRSCKSPLIITVHDYGDQSFDDTLAALDDAGIVHFGYDETAVMDVKGTKWD